MSTTIITPYAFEIKDNTLLVSKQQTNTRVLTLSNIVPTHEELISRQCSNKDDFFDIVIDPMIKEELEFNDIEVQIFKNFLEEHGYFE